MAQSTQQQVYKGAPRIWDSIPVSNYAEGDYILGFSEKNKGIYLVDPTSFVNALIKVTYKDLEDKLAFIKEVLEDVKTEIKNNNKILKLADDEDVPKLDEGEVAFTKRGGFYKLNNKTHTLWINH